LRVNVIDKLTPRGIAILSHDYIIEGLLNPVSIAYMEKVEFLIDPCKIPIIDRLVSIENEHPSLREILGVEDVIAHGDSLLIKCSCNKEIRVVRVNGGWVVD